MRYIKLALQADEGRSGRRLGSHRGSHRERIKNKPPRDVNALRQSYRDALTERGAIHVAHGEGSSGPCQACLHNMPLGAMFCSALLLHGRDAYQVAADPGTDKAEGQDGELEELCAAMRGQEAQCPRQHAAGQGHGYCQAPPQSHCHPAHCSQHITEAATFL